MGSAHRVGASLRRGLCTAVMVTGLATRALGGGPILAHGGNVAQACANDKCVYDATDCIILAINGDDFGDSLEVTSAWQVVDPQGVALRVPATGNLPIIDITGNAYCQNTGGVCAPGLGENCSLPCRLGPPGSTLSGLPGDPDRGEVFFRQAEYVIQASDETPLRLRGRVEVSDLCDSPFTVNCSTSPHILQFTTAISWCDPDDHNVCTTDSCTNGVCAHEDTSASCDDGMFCNGAEICDSVVGCTFGPPPCPEDECCYEALGCVTSGVGDYDHDCFVRLADYSALPGCFTGGPEAMPDPPPPLSASDCLQAFDSDFDSDLDLVDFAEFQRSMSDIE